MLASLATRAQPTLLTGLATGLLVLARRLVEMDSSPKSMANAIRCRSVKVMVSNWLPIHLWPTVIDCS